MKRPPFVMVIIDGWGVAPAGPGNAITLARLTVFPDMMRKFPHALLKASGASVGLPPKQVGNSEAGHLNIGAGRIVEQDAVRINATIKDGTFFRNPAFIEAMEHTRTHKSRLHILCLLTDVRSGHAYPTHLHAMLRLAIARGNPETYVHLMTDGRDTQQFAAPELLKSVEASLGPKQTIATVMGRLWGMDRAKRWSRTELAYNALVHGRGRRVATPEQAVLDAYNRGESDEYIAPSVIGDAKSVKQSRIHDNDSVIFLNLRSDRARQITKAFVQDRFLEMNPGSFRRTRKLKHLRFVAMTDFGPDLPDILTAFPTASIAGTLPFALKDTKQLYIAESEKFAHITYFINGGHASAVANEERVMISSSNVESFAEDPAMETEEITKQVVAAVTKGTHESIIANFANADMVGHTGNIKAAITAVTVIDRCLGRIRDAVLSKGGTFVVTADHGNIEEMLQPKAGGVDTEHSANPVPLVIATKRPIRLKQQGILANVAPTVLDVLQIPKPESMTHSSLLRS